MLCIWLKVCLHEVGKETSDPRPLGRSIDFLFVSLELRSLGSWPCYVFSWKCVWSLRTLIAEPRVNGERELEANQVQG